MKKIFPLMLICLLMTEVMKAQEDSVSYERSPFQFTFLFPPLSTNGAKNAHMINDVSMNLFLGISGGVEKFEAATFINIDRYYMNGVQVAGFGNTVGGDVNGAQMAGFYNLSGTRTSGFQGAGFVNVAAGSLKGAQAAGFVNVAGDSLEGFQGAGFINVAGRAKKGVQIAGFGNVIGGGPSHFQGAGFFNVAEEVEGAQIAGFLNVAGTVKGFQGAAFLNVCDSIDGVPLALFSVVKKNGYRNIGFTISEVQYANLSFKMGVRKLYNIYSFGKPKGPGSRWMFGGGLGTEIGLSEKLMLNIEGTVHQELWIADPASTSFLYIDRLNLYNTVKFLFGWNMGKQVGIHIGPTFNVSVAHSNPSMGVKPWHQIAPYSFYNRTNSSSKETNVQMWVGLQGSISF
jgi:hypothetical protein